MKAATEGSPIRDPHGSYERAIVRFADEHALDGPALVEEWHERAAVREYLGNVTRADADAAAWLDIVARFTPRPPEAP